VAEVFKDEREISFAKLNIGKHRSLLNEAMLKGEKSATWPIIKILKKGSPGQALWE
jgi:hypothetical protein